MSDLSPAEGTGIPGLEALRRENYRDLLDRVEKIVSLRGLRVLEVGCAWGWFLEAAQARGAIVHGIEPEKINAEICQKNGFTVECGFFPQDLKTAGPYDLIVFNDVFEHIPQPDWVIKAVESLLSPGGLVVINHPSSDGVLFLLATMLDRLGLSGPLERLWQKGLPSPHVSYFNTKTLRRLVQTHTNLHLVDHFPLTSVSRTGLADRVSASHTGIKGKGMVAAIWLLSFIMPALPSDIQVGIFRRA